MADNKSHKKKNENILPIRDLIFHCLKRWYWFVITVGIALGIAAYKIKSTPPQYVRYAEILIKESDERGGSGSGSTFKQLGEARTSADAAHEVIAFTSADNMKEAIRRLGLEIEFRSEGTFYDGIIYKDRPLKIKALDLNESDAAGFVAVITSDSTVTLKDFSINGESLDGQIIAQPDSIANTPLGQISIEKTHAYNMFRNRELHIKKYNIDHLANSFCGNMKAGLTNEETSIVGLRIKDVSTVRATDILRTIIEIYNEKWVEESNYTTLKTAEFIKGRADDIKQELEAIDREIAKFRGDNKLSTGTKSQLISEAESSKESEQLLSLNNQLELANFIKTYMAQAVTRRLSRQTPVLMPQM
ncbi:MAG: hypothetical protein IIW77_05980 [Bacteroidaceae bacterium]|nr:hypothetical protein [Bacteroidaceae bacterium]